MDDGSVSVPRPNGAGSPAGGPNQMRFEAVRQGFARARDRAGCGGTALRFAGQRILLRIAGGVLARAMQAPFAHLGAGGAPRGIDATRDRGEGEDTPAPGDFVARDAGSAGEDLGIELWDVRETGVAGPSAAGAHVDGRVWDLGDSLLAVSADARFVSHEVRGSVVWLDRRARRIAGWVADGAGLSLHQRGKPLQVLLALWASDRGLHAVHAGLVGRDGRGVLLPGRSGAGKSTAALACLRDGYAYAGDDWIALGRGGDGSHVGHGLYGTAALEARHAQRFADLQPQPVAALGGTEEKSLLLLSQLVPERLAGALPIRALALPRVVDSADCQVRAASRREALLTIVPSSIFTMSPRGGRRDAERLFELAAQLPAYWLEIGRDLDQIPRRVDDILREVGGS